SGEPRRAGRVVQAACRVAEAREDGEPGDYDGSAEDVPPGDDLVRQEVPERHGPDDRGDEQRLDDGDSPAVESRRLEHDADELSPETHEPHRVGQKLRERSWAPARNIGAHRRALPERGGQGEGRRSEDGEDGSYLIHSPPTLHAP